MVAKIARYQKLLENLLIEEADSRQIPGIEFQVITDEKHHQYQLVETGWHEKQYIHQVLFHFQIKPDGKVWLLVNQTDRLVAEELVGRGIPASDLVIGFHPASVRPFTGFAVA